MVTPLPLRPPHLQGYSHGPGGAGQQNRREKQWGKGCGSGEGGILSLHPPAPSPHPQAGANFPSPGADGGEARPLSPEPASNCTSGHIRFLISKSHSVLVVGEQGPNCVSAAAEG